LSSPTYPQAAVRPRARDKPGTPQRTDFAVNCGQVGPIERGAALIAHEGHHDLNFLANRFFETEKLSTLLDVISP
jgi:hypothetical protein